MASKKNATCSICGKEYQMCISCKDEISLNPWKRHTDTSEHYKIYQIIHGYSTGVYNKSEAKSKFNNVDLSDLESLRDNIKSIINDIMSVDEPEKIKPYRRRRDIEVVESVENKIDDTVSFVNDVNEETFNDNVTIEVSE